MGRQYKSSDREEIEVSDVVSFGAAYKVGKLPLYKISIGKKKDFIRFGRTLPVTNGSVT
jgi:hypothetical protein